MQRSRAPSAAVARRGSNYVFSVGLPGRGWPLSWKLGFTRATVSRDTPTCVPQFGGAVSAVVMSRQSVAVSWSPATDFSGDSSNIYYDICVSTARESCFADFSVAASTPPGAASWEVTQLEADTTYYFVVRATNPAGFADSNHVEVSAKTCGASETACAGRCVSTANDTANCGGCNNRCGTDASGADAICLEGQCCAAGSTLCNGRCTQVSNDPSHCGVCGNWCDFSAPYCVEGRCSLSQDHYVSPCAYTGYDYTRCSGSCVDTRTDRWNCGACRNSCPDSSVYCVDGQCSPCPAFTSMCNGTCVRLRDDPSNCGACATRCGTEAPYCVAGRCLPCPSGQTLCGGTCKSTQVDRLNCGSCGNECGAQEVCRNSQCGPCAAGTILCSGYCMTENRVNCGACGNVCPAQSICVRGQCTPCPANQTACFTGPDYWQDLCTSTQTDPLNCGACLNFCPYGCVNGRCVPGPCGISYGPLDDPSLTPSGC